MGIQVEFNPDLALRAFGTSGRSVEECLPEKLEKYIQHPFLKKGQRLYYLLEPVPLKETKGNQQLSSPLAAIKIIEPTHVIIDKEIYTKGKYMIVEVLDNNSRYFFNGLELKLKEVK